MSGTSYFLAEWPISAPRIAERAGIPRKYLSKILGDLVRAGFLEGSRGKSGGFRMARAPHVARVALPIYPQFGTEPNGYYIPPKWVPIKYLEQMFGPGVQQAVERYPAGVTTHMALADVIEKDTRIPPRGFDNAAYAAAGAPAVGIVYADGQYWDDSRFWIPDNTERIVVTVNYQTVTRHYIEALRDANVTNNWGDTLYQLWLDTDKGAPLPMVASELVIEPFNRGDADGDGRIEVGDHAHYIECLSASAADASSGCGCVDFDGDGDIDLDDFRAFQSAFTGS